MSSSRFYGLPWRIVQSSSRLVLSFAKESSSTICRGVSSSIRHDVRLSASASRSLTHNYTTSADKPKRTITSKPSPFPVIASCPNPKCACASTPTMPQGLEIDHSKGLNGTMPTYAEQVIICTGKDDWASRIEEEHSGDNLAADIKELVGRGGKYADVG